MGVATEITKYKFVGGATEITKYQFVGGATEIPKYKFGVVLQPPYIVYMIMKCQDINQRVPDCPVNTLCCVIDC